MRSPRNDPLAADPAVTGAAGGEHPERRCILTGRRGARDELVRLALSPPDAEGVTDILPDPLARAPGRGAWIGVDKAGLGAAIENGKLRAGLARGFKGARPRVADELPELIEEALARAALQRLGLALRAGALILGSDRIERAARSGQVAALYHAADASADGARKLDQAWRVGSEAEGSDLAGARLPLDRAALSVALGRENVVHLALADAGWAERIANPLRRLTIFLAAPPGDRASAASGEQLVPGKALADGAA